MHLCTHICINKIAHNFMLIFIWVYDDAYMYVSINIQSTF